MTTEALAILESLAYIFLIAFVGGVTLFVSRKAGEEAMAMLAFLSTPLRKVFDPGNVGAVLVRRVLKIDPAPIDTVAERMADAIDKVVEEKK